VKEICDVLVAVIGRDIYGEVSGGEETVISVCFFGPLVRAAY
jgi:hypothetical protein